MKYFFILLISILIMAEGCRPPRCPLPNCYVRMKHRHGGENWKAAATPSDFDPDRDPSANRGKEFRGVPWWKKNKNPKIGDGYKPGYKYDHKKPKLKKPRKQKKLPEEELPATGEEPVTEEEELQEEGEVSEPSPEDLQINGLRTKLYYSYAGAVYAHDITAQTLSTTPLIRRSFYGLGLDPVDDILYGAEASFTGDSKVIRYNPSTGTALDSVNVTIGPNGFVFR